MNSADNLRELGADFSPVMSLMKLQPREKLSKEPAEPCLDSTHSSHEITQLSKDGSNPVSVKE